MKNGNRYIDGWEKKLTSLDYKDATRINENFENEAYVQDGVVRWKSNDRIPPSDILEFWDHLKKPFDYKKSLEISEKKTEEFLNEYRKQRKNYKPSEEELFEMRAAFGPEAEVIDIITSQKIKL